jgi:uncharacterized repeat protein (TIGR03803 family)
MRFLLSAAVLPVAGLVFSLQNASAAEHAVTALYDFKGGSDGDNPVGGLAADKSGNIYGTTYYDGHCVYCGDVFMLRPPAKQGQAWSFNVIYYFPSNSGEATGALTYHNGVIYGTAITEVFSLRPTNNAKTAWKHTTLHRFKAISGQAPVAGVVFGLDGALYGSTEQGGKHGAGTIFRLSRDGASWSYELLYSFDASKLNEDQAGPVANLLIDPKTGVIYGTTYSGGKYGQGTVFSLEQKGASWEHTVIHDFKGIYTTSGPDGSQPRGALVFGSDGAMYGTTESGDNGGFWNQGTIYRLAKSGSKWSYAILHEFTGGDKDGSEPKSGLTVAKDGSFYGTTSGGGPNPYEGVVYRFAEAQKGKWDLSLLYHFRGGKDGAFPWAQPILVNHGLYGTTLEGGRAESCNFTGCGAVYRVEQ